MGLSLYKKYQNWTTLTKIQFWGSIASIIGFVLSLLGFGSVDAFVRVVQQPLLWVCVAGIVLINLYFRDRQNRRSALVTGLKSVPKDSRAALLRNEYANNQPTDTTPTDFRLQRREQYIFILLFLLLLLLFGTVVSLVYRSIALAQADTIAKSEQLKTERDELRRKLDETSKELADSRERDRQLLIVAAEAHGMATALDDFQTSETTKKLKAKNQELLTQFKSVVNLKELSEDDQRRIRVAEAQIAVVEGRFNDALTLTSSDDAKKQKAKTEAAIEQEVQLVSIRADSFFALAQWNEALAEFDRLCELRPNSLEYQNRKASCLYQLDRLTEALKVFGYIINELFPKFEHGSEQGETMAAILANFAGVLVEIGNMSEAYDTISSSIDIYRLLRKKKDSTNLKIDLVKALERRAGIFADNGQLKEALKDYKEAEDVAATTDSRLLRAGILNDRATVFVEFGNHKEALSDLTTVIEIVGELVDHPGFQQLRERLAEA
jgi:tetratricopeptide (TPR) repeat protein